MSDEPNKYTLRVLRYIEPGSDSPWKEVFGTQSDGTHRPQYYSQLELPKILEQIAKDARSWFPPEALRVLSQHQLTLLRKFFDTLEAGTSARLSLRKPVLTEGLCSSDMYLVALLYIFLSSEGKALARAALKLYTGFNASGDVMSSMSLGHLKGFLDQSSCASSLKFRLRRLLASSGLADAFARLDLTTLTGSDAETTCALNLSAQKSCSSTSSCSASCFLDYHGYGVGFYGYGLYGV